jgi:hypothetical protein
MSKRRWFEQADTLEVRLAEEATRLRDKAELFPLGAAREELLRKAR